MVITIVVDDRLYDLACKFLDQCKDKSDLERYEWVDKNVPDDVSRIELKSVIYAVELMRSGQ